MSNCKVSVIVPVYNAERFLEETLGNILQQSLEDIEVICVDDCSSDGSLSVLRSCAQRDDRIKLIELVGNSGTAVAINAGLDVAQGEFVQIVGNDDLLEEGALTYLYDRCTREAIDFIQYGVTNLIENPDDPALASRAEVKERYHRIAHTYPVADGLWIMKTAVENDEYRMTNGPQFVRRSLIENGGIRNLPGVQHEDMYFTYKLFLAAKRCTIDPKPLYRYRIRRGSQEDGKKQRERLMAECRSFLHSASRMAEETPDEIYFDPAFAPAMDETIHRYYREAARKFLRIAPDQQRELCRLETKTGRAMSIVLEESAARVTKIERSYSYRIGHAILSPLYRTLKAAKSAIRRPQ